MARIKRRRPQSRSVLSPKIKLGINTKVTREEDRWNIITTMTNNSNQPAFMIKLKVVGEKSRERLLPVIYSDNFVTLMPGEKRVINMEVQDADTRGEKPEIAIEGWNIE